MTTKFETRCCVVGGGPAGMMLGFLLERSEVDVIMLEKHADFLRDFRGDTIHPSTLELMYELGVLEEFLKRPHQEIKEIAGQVGKETVSIGDFTHPMRAVDRADSSGSLVPKTCPKGPSLVRLVWIRFGKLRPTSNWCFWCPDESMAPVLAIAGMVARTVNATAL